MRRGGDWAGIVEHVVVMGAPVSTRLERWAMARSVVAGRFVNAYSRRDWVLGLIYRGANGELLPFPVPSQGPCTCIWQVVSGLLAAAVNLAALPRFLAAVVQSPGSRVKTCHSSMMGQTPHHLSELHNGPIR